MRCDAEITRSQLTDFIQKLELQAIETAEERIPLYLKIGIKDADLILDVGCGTGVVTKDISRLTKGKVIGIDGSKEMIHTAQHILKNFRNTQLTIGKAEHLPFPDNTFDLSICNLLLMWVDTPQQAINEMARVTKPDGKILASLEPDFGGKIHFPEQPNIDTIFSGDAIRKKQGDPHIGRKLRMFFTKAGLHTEVGIGNNRIWSCEEDKEYYLHARDYYIKVLRNAGLNEKEIDTWEFEFLKSLDEGIQLNFFPQFYAIGTKPVSL